MFNLLYCSYKRCIQLTSFFFSVPKVYVLGPPSADRTLLCTVLALKLGLMLIAIENLLQEDSTGVSPTVVESFFLLSSLISTYKIII